MKTFNEKQYMIEYREKNKDRIKDKTKEYRQNNIDKVKKYLNDYREKNKDRIKDKTVEWKDKNADELREKRKIYYLKNKHKRKKVIKENKPVIPKEQKIKDYKEKNKEKIKSSNKIYNDKNKDKHKAYYQANKEKIIKYQRAYKNKRKSTDSLYKLKFQFSKILSMSFKRNGYTKKSKTCVILGCTFQEFKEHLEKQFEPWMNWGNKGLYNGTFNYGWDIDHIVSQSTATTEDEFVKLNHYTNLQPLCSKVNRDIKKNY